MLRSNFAFQGNTCDCGSEETGVTSEIDDDTCLKSQTEGLFASFVDKYFMAAEDLSMFALLCESYLFEKSLIIALR